MRRTRSLAALAILAGLAGWAYLSYRDELTFYVGLLRAYLAGRRFYDRYPQMARDVAFHPEMAPRLDVYSPPDGTGHPVLLFVHGGGWDKYDRKLFAPVAQKVLPHNIVVVIPDYTLHPGAGYEQMVREVAAALHWTREQIAAYGGDPERIVLAGHSAGAHLAALAIMDPRFAPGAGDGSSAVCGFLGMSGVYDVQREHDFWQDQGKPPVVMAQVMGGQANYAAASPLTYVRSGLPPVLLVHGDQDRTVPLDIAERFFSALQAAGAPVQLKVYPGAGHTDYLFAALARDEVGVVADIAAFVQACTAPK